MTSGYSPAQRRVLAEALARGERPLCPACGAAVAQHAVGARPELPYVRHRVLLICPACKRSVALDAPAR